MKTIGILIPDVNALFEQTLSKFFNEEERTSFEKFSLEDKNLIFQAFDDKWIEYFHDKAVIKFEDYLAINFDNQLSIVKEHKDSFKHFFADNNLCHKLFDNLLSTLDALGESLNSKIIVALYGELLRVSDQIFQMLLNGYADGALRIWRILHERSAILLLFLKEYSNKDIFIRFIDHDHFNQQRQIKSLNQKHTELKFSKPDKDALLNIDKLAEEYNQKYGKDFLKNDFGWVDITKKINFRDIEDLVNLGKLRPYYIWASKYIHSSFGSLKDFIEADNIIKLRNITNQTLDANSIIDPLQLCLLSVHEVNLKLLELYSVDYEYEINVKLFVKVFETMKDTFNTQANNVV